AKRFDEALDLAVTGLVGEGRSGEVLPLLDTVPTGRLSNVGRAALLAELRLATDGVPAAEEEARRGAAAVTDDTSAHALRRLTRMLMRLNLHALAFPLLRRTANTSRFDPDTRMLLDCANRLGKHQIVLEVCRALREAGEGDRWLLDNEVNLLQVYNRPAAIGVLRSHLELHPDDRLA